MHIAGSVFTRYDDIMLDPNVKNCHRLNSATISVKMAYETLSLGGLDSSNCNGPLVTVTRSYWYRHLRLFVLVEDENEL